MPDDTKERQQFTIPATEVHLGDHIYDPAKTGTHGQKVVVEWVGHHKGRKRTYFAGVEELSNNPVTVAYDDTEVVKVFRS